MARSFGKFTTSIYDSDEFRALTFEQQGVYYMLGLQGEISAAGVLPLRLRRWTRNAAGADVGTLLAALGQLCGMGHVVYDEDTEELLIVKFVKWDKGYANEKRRPVITEAVSDIASPRLRAAVATELRSLAADPDTASDAVSAWLRDTASAIEPDTTTRFDRSVVTEGESDTPSHTPQAASRAPVAASAPRADLAVVEPATAQTLVAEWIDHCTKRPPGQVIGQVAKSIDRMLGEGIDPSDVRNGLAAWHSRGLSAAVLPAVVNEVMNAPPGAGKSRQQQHTDDMFDRAARRMGVTA